MKFNFFNSISFRISSLSIFFTISVLIIMGYTLHQHLIFHFTDQNKKQIEGKIQLIQNLLHKNPNDFNYKLDQTLIGHEKLIVQIQENNRIIYQNRNKFINIDNLKFKKNQLVNWTSNSNKYQGILKQNYLSINDVQKKLDIIVAMEVSDDFNFLHYFKQKLLYIGLLGTIIIMGLSWLATWRGLKPIRQMAFVAENISANNLTNRIDLKNTPTEIYPLALAFNDMLERIETSIDKLSRFSSDLAHEMRTPINNLMIQTQVSLSKLRTISDYHDVLCSNLEEYERLAKMVSDMLYLAKIDHQIETHKLIDVELAEIIIALYEFYEIWSTEKNISLKLNGAIKIKANEEMIRRAFSNLISNAIKYGEPNSEIRIDIKNENNHSIISVKNRVSISLLKLTQEDLNKFFDRFYRLDFSRERIEDGTGLGLAITRSIFDMHKARISVKIINQDIVFTIVFPLNHS